MDYFMGYTQKEWDDFYKMFFHEHGAEPKNLFELRTFWELQPKRTTDDCFAICAKLAACRDIESKAADMIYKFLLENDVRKQDERD